MARRLSISDFLCRMPPHRAQRRFVGLVLFLMAHSTCTVAYPQLSVLFHCNTAQHSCCTVHVQAPACTGLAVTAPLLRLPPPGAAPPLLALTVILAGAGAAAAAGACPWAGAVANNTAGAILISWFLLLMHHPIVVLFLQLPLLAPLPLPLLDRRWVQQLVGMSPSVVGSSSSALLLRLLLRLLLPGRRRHLLLFFLSTHHKLARRNCC